MNKDVSAERCLCHEPEYLTIRKAVQREARLASVGYDAMLNHAKKGTLPHVKITGARLLVKVTRTCPVHFKRDVDDIDRWLANIAS